jgi:crotonobetainyl-CoA:carnitine CoA-transferase CaiB-like acyl-CoA transferase
MARLSLDFETVAGSHPSVIYLSMSAFGQTGPLAQLRAYAPIMSSLAGVESLIGYHREPPIGMMNYGMADPNAAIHGLLPVLAALFARQRTGRGAHIDLSQVEAMITALPEPTVRALTNGEGAYPTGNRHPAMIPHGIFPAAGADRWVTIAVSSDQQWSALAPLIRLPDASLNNFSSRLLAIDEIEATLAVWTAERTAEETSKILNSIGIASSPVASPAQQRAALSRNRPDLLHEVVHPILGAERLFSVPWRMSMTPPCVDSSAPLLGADNVEVFSQVLGIAPEEIDRLKADGIIT